MKIVDHNDHFFRMVPEGPTEVNSLKRFPGFRLIKGNQYIPKKPAVIQDIITRFKKIHKKPIDCPESFIKYMKASPELKEIPESFPWINKPYPHQELALRYLYTHGSAGLLLEPGLGKTFVVLNYIKLAEFKKSLIVCPKALLFVWEDEVAEHRPDLKVHVMESTSWDEKIKSAEESLVEWTKTFQIAENKLGHDGDTKLATYEKQFEAGEIDEDRIEDLRYRFGEFRKARSKVSGFKRQILNMTDGRAADLAAADAADVVVINYEKVVPGLDYLIGCGFDFIAVDEGLIKDVKTNRTKAIQKLGGKIPNRVIMSGTLVNNGPLDIFSPVKFIEPALSGAAYGAFEHYYARIAQASGGRRFVAGVGKRQTAEIRDILAACSIIMTKDEWLDLPDKYFHRINVPMSSQQQALYDDLAQNHICNINESYIEVENPLSLACYLNQIANGFLYTYESEGDISDLWGEPTEVDKGARETVFIESGKKAALRDLVLDQLKNKKFILWYNMTAEYTQICEVLEELGVKYLTIRGGSKDTGSVVHEFNKSGDVQVLVCQSQAVNYGITVLGSNPEALDKAGVNVLPDFDTSVYNHVFWSLSWSLERYTQQQDRSHRIGQTQDVHYWILSTECGIETTVYERLELKEEIRDSILVDYVNSIGAKTSGYGIF